MVGYPHEFKSFPKKAQAVLWEETRKAELKAGKRGDYPKKTVLEALQRYREEEAPKHKGARWEVVRLLTFERYPIASKLIQAVTDDDMAHWREARLKQVSAATVRREMVLWGQVFEAAREQWRWVPKNIMEDVRKPSVKAKPPKRPPAESIPKMVEALGTAHKSREVALGFLLGCETAMRPWEMAPLEKAQVAWRDCVAHLDDTKNGDERDVPLSPGAIEILAELDRMNPESPTFFTVSEGGITKLWSDARTRAGYSKGMHFRHARREGIWRLSRRLEILDLARAIGHRNLNSLLIYYQASGPDMAALLQTKPSRPPPSSEGAPPPNSAPVAGRSDRTEPSPPDA